MYNLDTQRGDEMTITLPPELERAVAERARAQGTTPQLLALDELRRSFPPVSSPAPEQGNLAEFLGDFIGCLHSGEEVPGGAQMSTDSGKKFGAILAKKRREGKL